MTHLEAYTVIYLPYSAKDEIATLNGADTPLHVNGRAVGGAGLVISSSKPAL